MDVELFLEGQAKWEADSPHYFMMLYKMFHHAMDQGQKEVEQMALPRPSTGVTKAGP